jgi:hypothetical protein
MTVINGYEADPDEVEAIVAALVDQEDYDDPARLYARATSLLATYADVIGKIGQLRAEAVARIAADTASYAKTAEQLGLSKPRVQQLVKAAMDSPAGNGVSR